MEETIGGYMGKLLRVNLLTGEITKESPNAGTLLKWVGGAGLGTKILHDEVVSGINWNDPENRLIIATGPLTGTTMGGSGSICVVTKGALTEGAAIAEANGFFGAFLKFCGFDAIIVQGAADRLSYLYIHDGGAELRDATHLAGKDTWETEDLIKRELGKTERQASVFGIGPAGENLVRFACIVGDKGHVAGHNGVGAVMGSKKLKAIAVSRGSQKVQLKDREALSKLAEGIFDNLNNMPGFSMHKWGTLDKNEMAELRMLMGRLPIKNLTTNLWPYGNKLSEETVRTYPHFQLQKRPCWACRFVHCHSLKITEGPYAGYEGDEPDYELWAAFAPLIDNTDLAGAAVLSNEADRLGIEGNESGWLVAWIMECYEKGVVKEEDLDGMAMKWGDVEVTRTFLNKIAYREGVGAILAEGVMRASQQMGGEAAKLAVYTMKGNTPRMHDHRASWPMILDTVTSERGRDMDAPHVIVSPVQVGLPAEPDIFTPEGAATVLARVRGRYMVIDSLCLCRFNGSGMSNDDWAKLLVAATGWDFTGQEMTKFSRRVVNLLRMFNIRHGLTRELERPSPRYSSAPVDGVNLGRTIAPVWEETLECYYESMGWDKKTGEPLPETLADLGL